MKCYECKWLDRSLVLTSIPPQYSCTLGFGSHYADHECEYDFMPIVRCKDCLNRDNSCGMGEHKWCRLLKQTTSPDDYCSYGKRREESEVEK